MTFATVSVPFHGEALVRRYAAELLRQGPSPIPITSAELVIERPVRVFQVNLSDIAQDFPKTGAAMLGSWWYLLRNAEQQPIAVAELREGEVLSFSSLFSQGLEQRFARALQVASAFADVPESYELRVLEVRALFMLALWLHGTSDIYIPFLTETIHDTSPVMPDHTFPDRVKEAAEIAQRAVL